MDTSEIKAKFPEYRDWDDQDLADAINEKYNDPSEIELIWEGVKAGLPELWHGGKQLATRAIDQVTDVDPKTIRQADEDANQYGKANPYDLLGENPDKKVFDTFNPYRTGKSLSQLALPIAPSKATMAKKGWEGLKARAKFGGKVGAGYGAVLPTTEKDSRSGYWKSKGIDTGTGMVGGVVGGELMNLLIKSGGQGLSVGKSGANLVKNLVKKIQGGEQLPQGLGEMGNPAKMGGMSALLQKRIQKILDKANEQGGVISPEEALKIAKFEDIGYPAGSMGATKHPYEPLTPAQLTHDPRIAQEEIMVQGSPEYKQKVANQAKYMTGAIEKISEELQTPLGKSVGYTGSADFPSKRETGESIVRATNLMREKIGEKTGKEYDKATAKYGKVKIRPSRFMKAAEDLKNDATASNVLRVVDGYKGMIRQKMAEQAPAYKGQEGTMSRDIWSSGYGKAKSAKKKPEAELDLVTYEGIRKQLTGQIDELANSGKNEGAKVLRKIRSAMDEDVTLTVGHDVYKTGRKLHEDSMNEINIPAIKKALLGKYDDNSEKLVDDIKRSSPEQLSKLKDRMLEEGDSGQETWRKLGAQIWNDMVEKSVKSFSAEGYGKGRLASVAEMEGQLAKFGNRGREIGANSEKGKLLFGEKMAEKINDILLLSRNLEILGVGEVKTGYSSLLNLVDWGSRVLGKVPSLGSRATSGVMNSASKLVKKGNKEKVEQDIVSRTMGGPIFSGMRKKKSGTYPARYLAGGGARTGAIEGQKKKRGVLSP